MLGERGDSGTHVGKPRRGRRDTRRILDLERVLALVKEADQYKQCAGRDGRGSSIW